MHGTGIGVTYQSTMAEWKLSSQVKTQSTYDTEVTYVTGVMCDTRVMYQSGLSENHRLKTHGSRVLQESHMTQELHMEYFWHMKHAWHRSYVWILHEWRKNHIKHKKYKEIHMTQETRWHMRAPKTPKTHETHRALTTSVATTCNEEHIRQKEPSFMQWYICKCILGYTCFIYDTYDTSNKVKFMLY